MTRSFEDRRSGKPLSGTPGAEAERLAKVSRKADLSCSDKNEATLTGNDQPIECYAAHVFEDESLVAGNVTGGGGKATRTKT